MLEGILCMFNLLALTRRIHRQITPLLRSQECLLQPFVYQDEPDGDLTFPLPTMILEIELPLDMKKMMTHPYFLAKITNLECSLPGQ